jgi:hypothetical protein
MIDFLRRRFFPREDFIDFLGDGAMLSPNVQSVKLIFSPGSVLDYALQHRFPGTLSRPKPRHLIRIASTAATAPSGGFQIE